MSDEEASGREPLAIAALLVLGVGLRLAFVLDFPTVAFSDFRALVDFGLAMRHGWTPETWHWIQFNPGLAMALSVVFAVFPDPDIAARHATAGLTGLLPLLPFFLWRDVLSQRWRFLAGLLLALWPGQILFSGVVAQENWVLFPTVALGCLAVRAMRLSCAYPIAAGLLLALSATFRQEMLFVLVPAAMAGAGLFDSRFSRRGRAALLLLSTGIPLLAVAAQRHAASGRFTFTTEHGGLALLGSVVPGAADAGWVDPRGYIASVNPDLLESRTATRRAASRLALAEWRRRPAFHLLRSSSVSGRLAVDSDAENLFWSVGSTDALPEILRPRGTAFYARWFPLLRWELALIQGLFVASVIRGLRRGTSVPHAVPRDMRVLRAVPRRDAAILVLAACVVLKFGLQSIASPLGRLMVPATGLELLAIALGLAGLSTVKERIRFGLVTAAVAFALLVFTPKLTALAVAKDEAPRPVRRFPIEISGSAEGAANGTKSFARCDVEEGTVTSLEWRRAWLGPARIRCRFSPGPSAIDLTVTSRAGAAVRGEAEIGGATRPLDPSGVTRLDLAPDESGEVRVTLSDPGGLSFRR